MHEESGAPKLAVADLNAWYGSAHVLQGTTLELGDAPLAVIGRNGMGKTTLCQAITGLLAPDSRGRATGRVLVSGVDQLGQPPHRIARAGVAYVPQGRRVYPSLTVSEHFAIVRKRTGRWSPDRVFELFPRLAERRHHRGNELSGGEQQMLAIGRALMSDPTVLVMDEPSEGLAPAIAHHLAATMRELASSERLGILVVEQNLSIAAAMADAACVMVSGRIVATLATSGLLSDHEAQRQWLGVG